MTDMDRNEYYQKSEVFWDKGEPAPPMRQYLDRRAVRGRALVPGCGRGHEVALAVEHGLDATGLDIASTGVAEARALYPQFVEQEHALSLNDRTIHISSSNGVRSRLVTQTAICLRRLICFQSQCQCGSPTLMHPANTGVTAYLQNRCRHERIFYLQSFPIPFQTQPAPNYHSV